MLKNILTKTSGNNSRVAAFALGFTAGKQYLRHKTVASRCAETRPSWQQTMIRVKDMNKSVEFYQKHFGFTLIDKFDFPKWKFSVWFLATPRPGEFTAEPGSKEAHDFLWNYSGSTLELTHNHGTETQEGPVYHNSNDKINLEGVPRGGFGHIAVNTPDVYKFCDKLDANGVKFQKKPNEGRMKGLAFALDPDNYWVEVVRRGEKASSELSELECNLSQTMLRVKDPTKTIPFYTDFLGMTLLRSAHFGEGTDWAFSLYFLATLSNEQKAEFDATGKNDPAEFVRCLHQPVLELTHNHGTEKQEGPAYHTGNTDPQGFGHVGFIVDDVGKICDAMLDGGVAFHKKPNDGFMKGLAFALDPDGYRVEIIPRGGLDFDSL